MSQLRHLRDWVEVAGVYVSRRSNDDRGFALERIQRGNERVQLHACRLIAPEQSRLISADAEHPQRFNSACMEVAACEYWHRRQARKPIVIDVDAVLKSPPASGRCEADKVPHCRARRDDGTPVARKAEDLLQPSGTNQLEPRRKRRARPVVCVLVERRSKPVSPKRGGGHAARHEMEIARPARVNGTRLRTSDQIGERAHPADALIRQRPINRITAVRAHKRVFERGQISLRLALDTSGTTARVTRTARRATSCRCSRGSSARPTRSTR